MSKTVDIEPAMASIAALTIPGVTVRGESGVADSMLMTAATLAPRPEKFVTGLRLVHVEQTQQENNVYCTLHYRYYHCSLQGGLGGLTSMWPGLIKNVISIFVALSSHSTLPGTIDSEDPIIEGMGPVTDPAGNLFLGAEFAVTLLFFLEA